MAGALQISSRTMYSFAKAVRDGILYYEWDATQEDQKLGWGGSKLWDNVRSGLDWFKKHFAKEYMVLLD